jgi:hypothetical protein
MLPVEQLVICTAGNMLPVEQLVICAAGSLLPISVFYNTYCRKYVTI